MDPNFPKFMNQPPQTLCGRHPVLEALKAGHPIQRLLIAKGSHGPVVDEIFTQARQQRIPYDLKDRPFLDRIAGARHQGIVAYVAAHPYADYAQLLQNLDRSRAFLLFLDQIQDPHNLGAILRSAHAVGADALVIPERNAAGLNATAAKAAAGAAAHLPVCRVPNLQRALQQARDLGLWLIGLTADGDHNFTTLDFTTPCALVIGNEEKGLRRLIRKTCDFTAHIPMAQAQIGSFNASVAAALTLYEVFRQRHLS